MEHDRYWNHDTELGEGRFYRSRFTLRLKLHEARERYSRAGDPEIVPLTTTQGERTYFLAKLYLLIPDIRLTVSLYPYSTPADRGAVGEVSRSDWEGMKHEEVGSAQAWYYPPPDATLILWEALLLDRHRQADPTQDGNLATLWTGLERYLLACLPSVRLIATPYDDPAYEREQYQQFLAQMGYSPLTQAAWGKRLDTP